MTQRYSEEEPEDTSVDSPEAKARADEFAREMSDWRRNPMTVHVARGLQELADIAFRNLVSAGTQSTDPSVARYACQYEALTKLIKNMKEQPDGV